MRAVQLRDLRVQADRGEEKATIPAHLVGDPVANCLEDEVENRVTREDTVSESNSVDIKTGVEAETNFIIEKAKVSITVAYGHEWVTKHTFAQDLTLKVKPGDIAWVASTAPVLRDTGDFVLKLGNTTWTLHDVAFDTPDPSRTARFVVDHRALTPQERTTMCTHVEPDGSGLLSAPAGWVALEWIGSDGHDRMIGGPASNTLRGLVGSDLIRGEAGDDTLRGGSGADRISGGRGSDRVIGGRGADVLHGGPGRDTLRGGPGSDTIMDHAGATLVHTGTATGSGRDVVDVRDDRDDDTVICDSSDSIAIADAGDRVIGPCGQLVRGHG